MPRRYENKLSGRRGEILGVSSEELIFDIGGELRHPGKGETVTFGQVAQHTLYGGTLRQIGATESFTGEVSPPSLYGTVCRYLCGL